LPSIEFVLIADLSIFSSWKFKGMILISILAVTKQVFLTKTTAKTPAWVAGSQENHKFILADEQRARIQYLIFVSIWLQQS